MYSSTFAPTIPSIPFWRTQNSTGVDVVVAVVVVVVVVVVVGGGGGGDIMNLPSPIY